MSFDIPPQHLDVKRVVSSSGCTIETTRCLLDHENCKHARVRYLWPKQRPWVRKEGVARNSDDLHPEFYYRKPPKYIRLPHSGPGENGKLRAAERALKSIEARNGT